MTLEPSYWDDDPEVEKDLVASSIIHALNQSFWWATKDGTVIRTEDMTTAHCFNLLRGIRRAKRYLLRLAQQEMLLCPEPTADMASMFFENELNYLMWADPTEWIEEQPLVRYLASRTSGYVPPEKRMLRAFGAPGPKR